jgi:hypothetical protein
MLPAFAVFLFAAKLNKDSLCANKNCLLLFFGTIQTYSLEYILSEYETHKIVGTGRDPV